MLETHQLSKILFCPAFCSPFKTGGPPVAGPQRRLAMLKLALDHPQFDLTTIELDRGGISYTIDTIRALKMKGLRLILTDEEAKQLNKWKEGEELIQLAPPLSSARTLNISSTEIRARLKKGLYCGHLIPAKALEYIHKHRDY